MWRRYNTVRGVVLIDFLLVLGFCAIGRISHGETLDDHGLYQTAFPFTLGTAIGALLVFVCGWSPTAVKPAGVTIWLSTVIVGMIFRRIDSQGTAFSFVVVALISTAILLLGWRFALAVLRRRWRTRQSSN